MISLDDLQSSVDLYRGCVSFSLPLCSLLGGAGPGLDFAIQYNGNVTHDATTWNLTAPTGVLGLGWSLPIERIAVRFDHNTAPADQEIILTTSRSSTRLLQTGQVSADVLTYAAEDYHFWKIQRFLSSDRWEITREDGVKYVYGDNRSRRSTVEFGVCWGNWIGSSGNVDTQEPIAVAWDLSQIIDLWDNTVTFKYRQVTAPVGTSLGLTYTQAIYLDEIVGAAGDRAAFQYSDKTTDEYQDPHTTPPPPNAWQDRFEKQFLDRIELFSPTGEKMYTVKFDFTDGQGHTVFLGSGQVTKRLLMGVKTQYPDAKNDLPAVNFSYVMTAGDPAYGAMSTVTTAAGGVNKYVYTTNQDLDLCDRAKTLAPPSGGGVTYSQPRFWFEDDYIVVTWQGDNQQAQIMAYVWEGRWLEAKLGSLAVPTNNDYANLQVQTAETNFVVVAGTHALAYARDVTSPGSWISSTVVALDLANTDPIVTAAGDGFAAVLGQQSGKLNRLRFSGTAWVADVVTLSGGGTAGVQCGMAAKHNFIFSTSVLGNNSSDRLHLRIDYLDAFTQWQSTLSTAARTQTTITSVAVYAGDTYAVVLSTAPASGLVNYLYNAFYWSANYDNVQAKLLLQLSSATVPAPPELHGAFVGLGQQLFRFDGKKWGQQNVATITYPGEQSVTGVSYGFDQVLRTIAKTDGSQLFDLIVYNPNLSETATPWSVPTGMGPIAPTTGNWVARAARTNENQSNYVLLPVAGTQPHNAIYYQQPSGSWVLVLQIPDTLTATETPSLQVLDELYCIYQSGTNTIVYPLQNGTALSKITLSEQILVPNASPTLLIGRQSFVTYTGTWGAAGSTLTLRRVVRQNVKDKLQVFAVNTVQQDTGYQDVPDAQGRLVTAYAFQRTNATIDVDGYRAAYNLATSALNTTDVSNAPQGTSATSFFNDLQLNEATVTPAYPTNPGQDQFTNATQFLRLLRGKSYASQLNSSVSTNPAVATSLMYWFVFTQAITVGGERGFYARPKKSDSTLNQVPGTVETTFDPQTGLAKKITTYQYNSQATKQTLTSDLTYFWEQYDLNRSLNLLTPIIETIESTDAVKNANTITTWSNEWGLSTSHWAQSGTYIATTANPQQFNKWNANSDPLAPGWLLQTSVLERNARGLLQRATDNLSRVQSTVLDATGGLPVASFFNADTALHEAGYYGFETYEDNVAWSYTGGVSINDFIISGSFHTGSRCLQFDPDPTGTIGPISTWLNTTGSRSFVFSCWMLVPSGSDANINNANWSLQLETVGSTPTPVGPAFKLAFPAATGKWVYIHHITNVAKYRQKYNQPTATLQLTIKGLNESNNVCLIDELRFSAIDGTYSALVYDSSLRRVTATNGENGATMRPVLDVYDRQCALVGPDENVDNLTIPAFSRMQSGDGNFDPKIPNSVLGIQASSDGLYYDFDSSDIPDWTLPTNWTIAAGQLTFLSNVSQTTPPFGSPAQLKVQSFTNFAARVRFKPTSTIPYAGIGLDNLCVFWDVSESGWVIDYKKDGNWFGAVIRRVPFGEDWVLAVVDNLVLFYVDGSQVFAYQMTDVAPAGLLTMYTNGPGSFEELVISVDPQLSLQFTDGADQPFQEILLVDNDTVVINGMIPDVSRRPQRQKNTVMLGVDIVTPPPPAPLQPGPDQSRIIGDVSTYLAGANNQPVATLSAYIALNPPPYAQVAYENSPLSRPVKLAQPGIAVDSTSHVRTINYAQYVPNSVMKGLGFDSAASNYLLVSVQDEDGVNSYSLFNVGNQLLAQQVDVTPTGQTQKKYNSQKYFYDGAGNLVTIQTPNFFDPPAGSQAADWVINRTFTFLKQVESMTTPDNGQQQYKYDSVGRLSFVLDANGAIMTPQRILYVNYDDLNRVIEKGYVQNAAVSWSDIQQYTEYALPQGVVPVWANRYTYDDNCIDSSDFEACGQADNLIGRLWRAQTNSAPGSTADSEIFVYDRRGRILIINTAVARYDTNTYQSAFRYNNLDQLIETTYPRPLSQSGQPIGDEFKVGRFFDRLGRLVGVGEHPRGNEVFDPRNPISGSPYAEKYASFGYGYQNLVTAASFNNGNSAALIQRAYAYDVANRPTQISGDYYTQLLTYESGGFNGAGYFNGQIASAQNTYYAAAGTDRFLAPVLSDSRWAYNYDNLGRLTVAANSTQIVDSSLNFGGAIAAVYDANGNLLTVPRGAASETYSYQGVTPKPDDAGE